MDIFPTILQKVFTRMYSMYVILVAVDKGTFCLKSSGFERPRGTIEREDSRVVNMLVVHRTPPAAEIRAEFSSTVTQGTFTSPLIDSSEPDILSVYTTDFKPLSFAKSVASK